MARNSSLITVRSRRAPPVLVCKKCLKRADQGKELKRFIKAEVKRHGAAGPLKPPRLVMTGCFGICPKQAVVLASGLSLERGEYLLVSDEKSVAKAAEALMSRSQSNA
jgi:hypothetical protein